ncbi:MAG: DUF2062 domain-containing protein [Candidatus Omnitrophota bacterium]
MPAKNGNNKLLRFLKLIYLKIFRINDTPQKIALGFGLGVFTGIMPGIGPLAALTLAIIFRVNRASALLGSFLSNTWLSLITFLLSIKIGSFLIGVPWQEIQQQWIEILKYFHWQNLLQLTALKIILPVLIGYISIAFILALMVYCAILLILSRKKIKSRT